MACEDGFYMASDVYCWSEYAIVKIMLLGLLSLS